MNTHAMLTSVDITHPVILIRIQRAYHPQMTDEELYEVTRGARVIGPRRSGAKFVLTVFNGIVREVYEIEAWNPAGTTVYRVRPVQEVQRPGRWEFTGRLAQEVVRQRYLGKSVASQWKRGAAVLVQRECDTWVDEQWNPAYRMM